MKTEYFSTQRKRNSHKLNIKLWVVILISSILIRITLFSNASYKKYTYAFNALGLGLSDMESFSYAVYDAYSYAFANSDANSIFVAGIHNEEKIKN